MAKRLPKPVQNVEPGHPPGILNAMFSKRWLTSASVGDQLRIQLERFRNAVMVCSLLIATVSVFVAYKSWQGYHARAKKDRAITLLHDLAKQMKPNTRAAMILQDRLTLSQMESLRNGKAFIVSDKEQDEDILSLVEAALEETSTGDFRRKQSFELRWQIVSFLNALEVVSQAYASDVADQEIILNEQDGLYSESTGYFCHRYRHFIDHFHADTPPGIAPKFHVVRHYPAIERVVADLQERRQTSVR